MFRLIVKRDGDTVIDVNFSRREVAESLIPRYEEAGYTAEVIEE